MCDYSTYECFINRPTPLEYQSAMNVISIWSVSVTVLVSFSFSNSPFSFLDLNSGGFPYTASFVYLPQLLGIVIKTLSISVIPSRIHFTPFSTRFVWLWPLSLVALTTANCGKCLLAQFSRHKIRFVLGFSFNYACISFTFSRAALSPVSGWDFLCLSKPNCEPK